MMNDLRSSLLLFDEIKAIQVIFLLAVQGGVSVVVYYFSVIVCFCMYVLVKVLFWIAVWPILGKKLSF